MLLILPAIPPKHMEILVISVAHRPYEFSSNLEAEPLMVQLLKEGEEWRLKMASPVVGLVGVSSSARYGDYYCGYFGAGYVSYVKLSEIEQRRCDTAAYHFDHFEHQSTANGYFATVATSALIKDLNLLQLKLRKLPAISALEVRKLVEKQLQKVYWGAFSYGKTSGPKCLNSVGIKRFLEALAVKRALGEQRDSMALVPLAKRDYATFLLNLYQYPPAYFFHSYVYDGVYKCWGSSWGCDAFGVWGVNRSHTYDESTKDWSMVDEEAFYISQDDFHPLFYRKSYQRYKENGAICSGYSDRFFCRTDAGDEWRKAVGCIPDSVERKNNGPLKKAPYKGHNKGGLPPNSFSYYDFSLEKG